VELITPLRATHQQRIYTAGSGSPGSADPTQRPSLAQMSIDEGVELEASETGSIIYEMSNQSQMQPATNTGVTYSFLYFFLYLSVTFSTKYIWVCW